MTFRAVCAFDFDCETIAEAAEFEKAINQSVTSIKEQFQTVWEDSVVKERRDSKKKGKPDIRKMKFRSN